MPYAENDGVRLYFEVEGDGPPLVLHSGGAQRLQDWRREELDYVQALRDEYQLILMDPRGHGQSDKPHDAAAYAYQTRLQDVKAVLDTVGVERAHFWGYSMGAQVGFGLGTFAPERVRSLILGGYSPDVADWPDVADRRGRWAVQAARFRQWTTDEAMENYVAGMEAELGPFPPAVRRDFLANDPLALAAVFEAFATIPDIGDRLAEISAPTLIYAGDQDAPFAGAQRAAEVIPGAIFVALPGQNHAQANYAAEAILPHVRSFLGRIN
jgi:pimeloyl-ACP methyl ester carboxylesterase